MADIDINSAWENFCEDDIDNEALFNTRNKTNCNSNSNSKNSKDVTSSNSIDNSQYKCSELYISTKTKITYLNKPIDIKNVFWKIPINPYHIPKVGVIKKEMKFNSLCQEDVDIIMEKVKEYDYVENHIISQVNNPDGRIKFKDIRKVSIGLCKKDISSY